MLVALCLVPLFAPAAAGEDLQTLRAVHAEALIALSDQAAEATLFNEAERLLREAQRWSDGGIDVEGELRDLRETRAALVRSPERRDEHERFLRSKDCAKAESRLAKAERERDRETLDGLLELAGEAFEAGDEELGTDAVVLGLELSEDHSDLRRVAGKQRFDRLLSEFEERRGLAQLALGPHVSGAEVDLEGLRGKVVVWRSVSL